MELGFIRSRDWGLGFKAYGLGQIKVPVYVHTDLGKQSNKKLPQETVTKFGSCRYIHTHRQTHTPARYRMCRKHPLAAQGP